MSTRKRNWWVVAVTLCVLFRTGYVWEKLQYCMFVQPFYSWALCQPEMDSWIMGKYVFYAYLILWGFIVARRIVTARRIRQKTGTSH